MKKQIYKLLFSFLALRNITIIVFAIALCPTVAHAADTIWTGAGDGISWGDSANWATGNVPTNADATFVGRNTNGGLQMANAVIGAGVSATTAALTLGHAAVTDTGTLTIKDNGSLTTNGSFLIGNYGQGFLILRDTATVIHNTANLGGGIRPNTKGYIHITGSARLTMNGGSFISGERPDTAMELLMDDHSMFTMTHNNAIFYATYGGTHNTTGVGPTTIEIKDHGVLSLASGTLRFGYSAAATGTFTLRGNVTDGRGTAIVRAVSGIATDAYFQFDGGILRASDSALTNNFMTGVVNIRTIGEGAFIDSNGINIGIANTVTITGTSGFTKLGAGDLTLNNVLAYTGTTSVEAGSLVLTLADQLTTSSAVNVLAGGTLSSTNLAQTFNNLSGSGIVDIGTGAATFGGASTSTFSGNLTAGDIIKNGAGTLTLSGNNTITGNATLNGGKLVIGSISAIGSGEGKTLSIASGTLASSIAYLTLAHTVTVQNGAQLTVDSGAGKVELTGVITGDSGIEKTGSGDLIIGGDASGLTGAINVAAGGLYINNLNAGNITVAAGSAFGGSGTISGDLTFLGAGALQIGLTHNDPTSTDPSTLTITGNVSFGGAAALRYDMYSTGVDTIIANNASFNDTAANSIDLVNIQNGTFTLFKLTSGTFTGDFLDSLAAPPGSTRISAIYTLSADKTELQVDASKTNHVLTWVGASDNNWDATTANWSGSDSQFVSGDKVIFNLGGDNSINIDQSAGAVVSEMSITGDGSYTFIGGRLAVDANSLGTLGASFGGVAPTGDFTINTTGTVTLANDLALGEKNYFQNGINLQQGTLVGSVATLGDANIANNGKTIFDQDTDAIYTGTMTGAGILGKTGTGALQVGNNLSGFTGTTALGGGTFIIDNDTTYNSAYITGSSTDIIAGENVTITGSINIQNGNISIGDTSTANGDISVSGTGNISLGTGGAIGGGVHILNAGDLRLDSNSTISGPVSVGNNNNILLMPGSVIDNSIHAANSAFVWLATDTTNGAARITSDVTLNGSQGYIVGTGKIDGIVHASATTQALIFPTDQGVSNGVPLVLSDDNSAHLEIGSIVLDGSGELRSRGSGTLTTASIRFNGALTISNTGIGEFTVTGSLVGPGSVVKNGPGTVILTAPSSYTGPTIIETGTLAAAVEGAFSQNSAFTVAPGANLDLRGHNQTLGALINNGHVQVGATGAGAKLRIAGAYSGDQGRMALNLIAGDNTKTLSDQLILADAALASGTTRILIQITDNRPNTNVVLQDIDSIVIAESGEIDPRIFVLGDENDLGRIVIGTNDYRFVYDTDRIDLVADAAAELPTTLAANAVSIMAHRAAIGSVTQRLDYLRAANALPGSEDIGLQVWAQSYYRADKLDGKLFPNSDGTAWGFQAGIDNRSDKASSAHTTYGAFIDRTEASATLPNKTSTDLSSTGLGGYISAHTTTGWHIDGVIRYTWDKYKVTVGRRSMDAPGFTWGAMLRVAKIHDLGKQWELTPQVQAVYQNRKVDNMTDNWGRHYAFGPDHMDISDPSSFESRAGMGLRKVIIVNDRVSLAPYVSAHFLYEFKGNLAVQSVNNTGVHEDFSGKSYLFTVGIPVRLGKRIDAYVDGSVQTGGPITGHGINLGINYRW